MSELAERFTSAEFTDLQAAETTATTPETSTATATQTTGAGTGWTTATRLGVLAGSATVLTALTTAARGTKGERPEGAANQTETETDGSDGSESSGAGTETDTTETDTDTQGGEVGTGGEANESTDADGKDDGGDALVDQDADAEGDSREGDDETDDSESPNPDNSNTRPTPVNPVNPNAGQTGGGDDESDGMEGDEAGTPTDQDGDQTPDKDQQTDGAAAPAQITDGDEEDGTETDGGEESTDENDDDGDESVDQGMEAEGANIEVDRAEGAGGTDSTDSDNNAGAAIDGPDPMPMPQPNNPGTVTLTGTATEDQQLTATVTDDDTLPDAANIRYQSQRSDGSGGYKPIAGATGETYTLSDADVGREVRVQVSYRDQRGADERLISDATLAVTNINDGGDGNDNLEGWHGDDILIGGRGNDLFRFERFAGSDRITDFGTGNDRLEFGGDLFADLEAVRTAATQTDDGNLEITLSETEALILAGVTLAALTAETVTTLDEDDKDTTTPPADANSASDAPAFELDNLSIDEAAIMRLAASEGMALNPPEPQTPQAASEKLSSADQALALADPLGPPPALALFDANLEGYAGL